MPTADPINTPAPEAATGGAVDIVENPVKGPIKITISDLKTGDVLEERVLENDYAIICAGNRYVKNIQIMGRTHMLAIAVSKHKEA